MTTPFFCPDCGGRLELDTQCVIDEEFCPKYPRRDQPLPRRQRTAVVTLCTECEFCLEVRR